MPLSRRAAAFEISDFARPANARSCRPVSVEVLVTMLIAVSALYASSLVRRVPEPPAAELSFKTPLPLEPSTSGIGSLSDAGGSTDVVGTVGDGSSHTSALQQLQERCPNGNYSTDDEHFMISKQCFDTVGIDIVKRTLIMMPGLLRLDMHKCEIGDAGAQVLADALPQIPNLEKLELSANGIGNAGAKALADTLPQIPNIGDAGAQVLVDALPQIPNLEWLDLRGNLGAQALKPIQGILGLRRVCWNYDKECVMEASISGHTYLMICN